MNSGGRESNQIDVFNSHEYSDTAKLPRGRPRTRSSPALDPGDRMKPDFVELLKCPRCSGSFHVEVGGTTSASGVLECQAGHRFPVVAGIPRFVEGELYVANFGFEWIRHARTQLDSASSDESERTFRAKTGFTPDDLRGRSVLDAGCGMGRFSDVASRWGARVVAIDLSRAVEAADRNIGNRQNVDIAQADIFNLPFAEETFDYIFSIGVLHHTPDTKAAFDNLPKLLRKGGKIAMWVYPTGDENRWWFSDLYRRFTPYLPKLLLNALCYAALPLYYVDKIPKLGPFMAHVLPISDHPNPSWRVLGTFDWYSPRYQWKHSNEEVTHWFRERGLTDIRVLEVPVAIQATRP
jgi:SAM-dependent methyltransferase